MIYESYYWKNELLKSFQTICKFRYLKQTRELSCVKIEKSIMLSAYKLRKLKDAEKIPSEFIDQKIKVKHFEIQTDIIDHFNCHKINKNYNLEKNNIVKESWKYFLDQIIHSFTFAFDYDDQNRFDGFFINSDKSKSKRLYYIAIKDFLGLLLKISEGEIIKSQSQREIIKEKNGTTKFGQMKQINAEYIYPRKFDLTKSINNSFNGKIYKRVQISSLKS